MNAYFSTPSVFQALADPTRLQILALVEHGDPTATDLNHSLGMSQPRVARHLRVLVDSGLLLARREGRNVRYSLPRDGWVARLAGLAIEAVTSPSGAPPSARGGIQVAAPAAARRFERKTGPVAGVSQRERPGAPQEPEDRQPPTMEDFLL